ncbi:hypothetical protein J5X84_10905 [Streptosporangiaceae bacterium NEAU-GS5]|nr:hypothetical protein [Streptosporangiaceae bacterium NEAU-GS5]
MRAGGAAVTGNAAARRPAGAPTRRAMLGALGLAASGAALSATAACGGRSGGPAATPSASPPGPAEALLAQVISGKESLLALYQQAAPGDPALAARLSPFVQRHQEHLAALRKHLSGPPASPSAAATPSAGVSGPATVTLAMLRTAERRAAASRPAHLAAAPPVLSQLLASIGACEALHAVALGKLR